MRRAALGLVLAFLMHGQEAPSPRAQIRATGEAVIKARPDLAQIEIGLTSQAATAQVAAAQNATQFDAVLGRLRKLVGSKGEIRTAGYSLTPNYRYPREGGKPEITGYTATNMVQIETRDLDSVGALIDAATQAGANTVHSLRFLLRDEDAVKLEALRTATRKAKASVEAMATAAGLRILRVISVEQVPGPVLRPMREVAMARAPEIATAPTPVEPGTIEIHASVTLIAEAGP
ncbi:MAG: SIMPL domain-containing protein [Bryobacteraceae bacterium]